MRRFHFLGEYRPLLSLSGKQHRLQVKNVNVRTQKWSNVPARVQFASANSLTYCIRRKVRRRVMHALRFTGRRGRGSYRKPKFTWYSKISC
ncbi:MAG: hypothetical protein [Microviridae sp.]|nr:MAG: hypothetical protein [Microviridae sp.]